MPTVPISQGPRLDSAALQPVYQNAQQFTAPARQNVALSEGLQNLGQGIEQYQEREAVDQAFKAQTQVRSDWLAYDNKLRQEYQGDRADGYLEKARQWWSEAPLKYGENLNPRARLLVGKELKQYQVQAEASGFTYARSEKEKAFEVNSQAAANVTMQAALRDVTPATATALAQTTINTLREQTAQYAAVKGLSPEAADALLQKRTSDYHRSAVGVLLNTDAQAANAYYATNRAQIDGAYYAQMDNTLKLAAASQTAKQFADSVAPLPLAEQLKKTAEIQDPVLRERAQMFVKENHGLIKAAQQEREKQFSDQAWQMVGQGKRVPEQILQNMDGKERVQLQDYLRQRAEHLAKEGNKPVKTDPVRHAELWEMMVRDPAKFKETRLSAEAMKLSGEDLEQLFRAQKDILNPKPEKDVISYQNKVTGRLEMLKVASGTSGQEKRGEFRVAAQREFENFAARSKRNPTPKEEDEILDRLMLPGKTPWFSGNAATYGQSVATGKPFVPDVPKTDRAAIEAQFKARGVAKPTDEQIQQAYRAVKGIQ